MIKYADGKDVAIYNGYSFRRDKRTGYYISSRKIGDKRKRLHVFVWETHNGAIPKGFQIHHKDNDKGNNDIENLELKTNKSHQKHHGKNMTEEHLEKIKINLDKARSKAPEWHGSEKGREWHKDNYQSMKHVLHEKIEKQCVICGNVFMGLKRENNKFCSNKCKSEWRRKSGIDDIIIKCERCGNEFTANKYNKRKYCSAICRNKVNTQG